MSNNKQSSIDWLEQELKKIPFVNVIEVFEQAKAMHKNEVTKFTEDWYFHGSLLGVDVLVSTSVEEHYNKTFK